MTIKLSKKSSPNSTPYDIPTRGLILGLPALFAMVAVLVCAITVGRTSTPQLVAKYHSEAQRSFRAGEYERAEECYDRLLAIDPDAPRFQYEYAVLQDALGFQERGTAILARLAPIDATGFAPAHIRQARQYLAQADASSSTDALRFAARHLQAAITGEPDNAMAHALLGKVYLAAGQSDLATSHLKLAVNQIPQARLELARAHQANGNPALAHEEAWQAIEYFRRRAATVRDDATARLGWAQAVLLLEDYAGAAALLRTGLELTHQTIYRQHLGEVYAAWSQSLAADPVAEPEMILATVVEGIQYVPLNTSLLMQLIDLSKSEGVVAQHAKLQIKRSLNTDDSMPIMHMLLGMDAQQNGDDAMAREHYERAYAAAPQTAIVANNLAWLLAHSDPTDLPRALEIIDAVVAQWPTQLDFRDTRGHILAKLGRQQESLAEVRMVAAGRGGDGRLDDPTSELID